MKIGVLGSGLMGKEAARDLVLSENVQAVGLADIDVSPAQKVCDQLQSSKLPAYRVNASDEQDLASYMRQFDVIINALFYSFNKVVAKTAIHVVDNSIDLGEHIGHMTDKVLALKK